MTVDVASRPAAAPSAAPANQARPWRLRAARPRLPTAPGFWLEQQICLIRWLGVAFIVPALLILPIATHQRVPLLGVVGFAAFYNACVPFLIRRWPDLLLPVVTACDALASAMFVLIVGFNSQQYIVLFSIIVASAMRVGLAPALLVAGFDAALDFGSGLYSGQLDLSASIFRSFFLALVATLSAVLYHYAKSEEALTRKANEQLQSANAELIKLDEMKSNFISNASHELRTPLTSIRSFSEMLLEDPDVERETRVEFVGIINSESERLSRLVNNLLDLSRMQAGGYAWRPAPLDLAAELHQLVAGQQPVAAAKGLELRLDLPQSLPLVEVDRDTIHQVLLNLVGNAIKFTQRGHVRIYAWAERLRVAVAVEDTGAGIRQEDLAHVFDRFYQAGSMLTDKPAGSGLGLAICKEILEQHGSELRVVSTPGQGSTFSFCLPLVPA